MSVALTIQEIREILLAIEESGWDTAQITVGDVTLALSKSGSLPDGLVATVAPAVAAPAGLAAPPAQVAPAADAPAPAEAGEGGQLVTAPSIGTFWRSPQPGAPPFTELGATVEAGDALCIVEVMKLMNFVVAPGAGTITAIHADNGQMVEHGAPLFTLHPAAG